MKEKHLAAELSCTTEFRVRFHDTDALGIVWHGNYIKFFEDAREDFGRKFGLTYLDAMRAGFSTPITKTACNHLLPLKYGEIFSVKTIFKNVPSAKIVFEYEIFNEDQKKVCKGLTEQVFWDKEKELQLYPPKFFLDWKVKNGLADQ